MTSLSITYWPSPHPGAGGGSRCAVRSPLDPKVNPFGAEGRILGQPDSTSQWPSLIEACLGVTSALRGQQ